MTRTDLHCLLDELPETSFDAAAVWLGRVRDPVVAKLQTAPLDDEPFTEGERRAVHAAMLRLDEGESVSLDALVAEFDAAEGSAVGGSSSTVTANALRRLGRPDRGRLTVAVARLPERGDIGELLGSSG